jgi:quinol monooxygenase YgiN
MEFDEELTDEFIEGFTAGVLASRADEGCLQFDVTRSVESPNKLVLVERWESQELLNKHWNLLQERRARQQQSQGPRPARVAFERYDYQRYEFDGRNYTPVND